MEYATWILAAALAVSTFIFWRKSMTPADLLAKLATAQTATDNAVTKLAAKDVEIADLRAKQSDPALLTQIADGLDAIAAKLS